MSYQIVLNALGFSGCIVLLGFAGVLFRLAFKGMG